MPWIWREWLIGSNSIAIKKGKQTALRISASILCLVVLMTFVPFLLGWFSLIYLLPISVMDIIIVFCTSKLLTSTTDEQRKYIRYIYLGATLGLLIFLLMRFLGI